MRNALNIARAVAQQLGAPWYAESMAYALSARLVGPEGLTLELMLSEDRDAVTLEVRSNPKHVAPDQALHIPDVVGVSNKAAALAWDIRDRVLPAWREREVVLTERTERARAAVLSAAAALVSLFPGGLPAFVTGGTSAVFRWGGGQVSFRGQGDGTVQFTRIELTELLEGPAGFQALAAFQGEPKAALSAVPAAAAAAEMVAALRADAS